MEIRDLSPTGTDETYRGGQYTAPLFSKDRTAEVKTPRILAVLQHFFQSIVDSQQIVVLQVGSITVLVGYETNPVLGPKEMRFSSSKLEFADQSTFEDVEEGTTVPKAATVLQVWSETPIRDTSCCCHLLALMDALMDVRGHILNHMRVQVGGDEGITFLSKSCARDCHGDPTSIPHWRVLNVSLGKLHLGCTSSFLENASDFYAELLPHLPLESSDTRSRTARQALCDIAVGRERAVTDAMIAAEPQQIYCEFPALIAIGELDVTVNTDIGAFVRNCLERDSVKKIQQHGGNDGEQGGSMFGAKIGLTLASTLVETNFSFRFPDLILPEGGQVKDWSLIRSSPSFL